MFYEMQRGRVGIITYEELKDDYVMYGFPERIVQECENNRQNFRSNHYAMKDFVFVLLDLIDMLDVFHVKGRVAVFLQKELCLIVDVRDPKGVIRRQFDRVVERYEKDADGMRQDVPERFLYHFLDGLMLDDRKFLENMEFQMSDLEMRMLEERVNPSFINEILLLKKELMYIWNYYEQLIDAGEVLRNNENDLFPEENVKGFGYFTERASRNSANVKYLKEYTVQLQETHDAMLDYNLNNIMKLFTMITTIFLPLTLIVGWYGMNFTTMPELSWRYGYAGVIVFSVVVVVFCVLAFKKHKLL